MSRRSARIALLAALALLLPDRGRPADPPAPDPKAKPAEGKAVELHKLTNADLVAAATLVYQKALDDYRAQYRALAAAESLFAAAQKQTDALKSVAPLPAEKDAAKAVEAAKAKHAAAQARLKLVRSQKELLDRVTAALDGCQSVSVAFLNALDDLAPYATELGLRLKDGTRVEVPPFTADGLDAHRKDVAAGREALKEKTGVAQTAMTAVAQTLAEVEKAALAAEAEVVEASKTLAREQKRLDMEKGYAGKKPPEMIAELAALVEDGIGLKGTYELALGRFNAQTADAAKRRKELEALKTPETKLPQLTRAEDIEVAAKAVQELTAFYAARTAKLEALRAAENKVASLGGEFEADAAVSTDHLFKMQVLADLLKKSGTPDEQLPEKARAAELDPAAARQQESASVVRAATEKAKGELPLLDKQLDEAKRASAAAATQSANLKDSREITLAAIQWEGQLKGMTAAQVAEAFTKRRDELTGKTDALRSKDRAYEDARNVVHLTREKLDALKDPLLRAAEEQGQAEKQKITGEFRKEAGLERSAKDTPAAPEAKKVEPDKVAEPEKKTEVEKKPAASKVPESEKVAAELLTFQQLLAARVRVLDEREGKKAELLAALDDLEKKGTAYSKALTEARLLAQQLNATAAELKKRIGKGELPTDQAPEGITDALRLETRTALDASATAALNGLAQLQQERDRLNRPDPEGDAVKGAMRDILSAVGQRLDLLGDLKRLAADYARDKKDRPPSEVKRLEQLAADRLSADATGWDTVLALDSSKGAKNLSELMESYYRELVEIEEKGENLRKQREKVEQLVELAQKEIAAVQKAEALLAKQSAESAAAREEETVLARARVKPDQADELLKAFRAKTGKLLPKPVPLADKEKAEKVEEIGALLFERFVQAEAAKKWNDQLAARLAPTGLKAEGGVYQDELAAIAATAGANARRVHTLTGIEPPEPGKLTGDRPRPATGGEIGATRAELTKVRSRGVQSIAVKIGIILLVALLLPRLIMGVVRRAMGGNGDMTLVLSALRAFVRAAVWVAAFAVTLSVLGFDVTAIIAGLGIGGLAIGLAAQPMIADLIGAVVIFGERRFKIGDVIRLGTDDPARVVGLTWRSTQVKNPEGLIVNIPNRKVTEASVQNLTKAGRTYDSISVAVTTSKDVATVLAAIREAMEGCKNLDADHGVSVKEFNHKGETKAVKYRFWWFLRDYETRHTTRDEVFTRITASLAREDMAGTEVTLA
ncbi:MAG TPA: mechanosensitive ion channel domain-containing protein [Gemmataceae bacterium]|nr:mechanosensitive ion channel domain-containing protein [Gemmataceae bacterium]